MASECVINSVPVMIIYIKYQYSVEKNNGILEGVDGFRWSHTEREQAIEAIFGTGTTAERIA